MKLVCATDTQNAIIEFYVVFSKCITKKISPIDDLLNDRYGEGEILERECPVCGYCNVYRSAGVHYGEEGSVAVYCQEDSYHCNACEYTEGNSSALFVD